MIQKINKTLITGIGVILLSSMISACSSGSSSNSSSTPNSTVTTFGDNLAIYQSNASTNYTFQPRLRSGTTNSIYNVKYFGTTANPEARFIGVGAMGTIITSRDGNRWKAQTSGTLQDIQSIDYGNGVYLAVGNSSQVLLSKDAENWLIAIARDNTDVLTGVVFAQNQFVIVGFDSALKGLVVIASPIESQAIVIPNVSNAQLNAVAFNNNTYVAVGATGGIVTSTNAGASWTTQTSGTSNFLASVAFVNGNFVAVGASGTVLSSVDGVTWTNHTSTTNTTTDLSSITYTNGNYIVGGKSGLILTSPDLTTWTPQTTNASRTIQSLAVGLPESSSTNLVVAVGDNGEILNSIAPTTSWTFALSGIRVFAMAANGKTFVASGYDSIGGDIGFGLLSRDGGVTWTSTFDKNTNGVHGVVYGGGLFVGVRQDGGIGTSPDGTTWTHQNSGTTNPLYGITYAQGKYVVVGATGTILNSTNATNWTSVTSPTINDLSSVVYGNGVFIAVGSNSTILNSTDGSSWKVIHVLNDSNLRNVTFANGLFMLVGDNGVVATSPNGTTWTAQNYLYSSNLTGNAYNPSNNSWYAFGGAAVIGVSINNGMNWTAINGGTTSDKVIGAITTSN